MSSEIAKPAATGAGAIEKVLIGGDLSALGDSERLAYYQAVCQSVGLNPLTQPFQYVRLSGGLKLYATKAATDQLRSSRGISLTVVSSGVDADGVYAVRVRASTPDGRADEDDGCVPVAGLKGDALCNARLKAITKAKRRVTLSICGLGMLDETEVETIPGARVRAAPVAPAVRIAPAMIPPASSDRRPDDAGSDPWELPRWSVIVEKCERIAMLRDASTQDEIENLWRYLGLSEVATPADLTEIQWKRAEGAVAAVLAKLNGKAKPSLTPAKLNGDPEPVPGEFAKIGDACEGTP